MAIVDWRDVPTWSEFEILRDAFMALGVPTIVCDPRDLVFANGALTAQGTRIDLVYRRVLINDILAKPDECRALVDAYAARARLHGQHVPVQDRAQEGVLRRADRPVACVALLDRERAVIHAHIPWTRVLDEARRIKGEAAATCWRTCARWREHLVLKPNDEYGGTGVTLGWEMTEGEWDTALDARSRIPRRHLDRAGADSGPARDLSAVRCRRTRSP